MLVLSRMMNETIMIGDDISVTVMDVRGDKVRLGINAPSATPVHRLEVYCAIKREEAMRIAARDQAEAEDRSVCSQGGTAQPGAKGK